MAETLTKMKRLVGLALGCWLSLGVPGCSSDGGTSDSPQPQPETIEPKLSVIEQKVFKTSCVFSSCHGGSGPIADLSLDEGKAYAQTVNVESTTNAGQKRVVPGDPESSLLYKALLGPVGKVEQMPQGSAPLSPTAIDAIKQWIANGAKND